MNIGKSFGIFWQKKQKIPDFYMKFGLSCILWSMGKFILKILGWKVKESWKKLLLQWYGLGKSFYCGGKGFRFYVKIFTPVKDIIQLLVALFQYPATYPHAFFPGKMSYHQNRCTCHKTYPMDKSWMDQVQIPWPVGIQVKTTCNKKNRTSFQKYLHGGIFLNW